MGFYDLGYLKCTFVKRVFLFACLLSLSTSFLNASLDYYLRKVKKYLVSNLHLLLLNLISPYIVSFFVSFLATVPFSSYHYGCVQVEFKTKRVILNLILHNNNKLKIRFAISNTLRLFLIAFLIKKHYFSCRSS